MQHLTNISRAERAVRQEFRRFYIKLESLIEQGYPERVIMRMVEREVKKLEKALQTTTTNAMSLATTQSVSKNALLLKSFGLDGDGLERIKIDLSPNIWKSRENLIDPIRNALKSGLSAADLAKEIVGDINTTHKGRGVYKEPVKNAMRVARTEINTTYHKNDDLIWSKQPMVLGKEIRLSNSPKKKARCWMCRGMAGKYPKEFMWTHWHIQCLCSQIPILMTDEQFRKWEDGKLDPIPYVKLGQDKVNWVNENSYKWANWKEPPRWLVNFEELNKS